MEVTIQKWEDRDLSPLKRKDTDLMVIENTPPSQMEIFKFVSQYYEVVGQNPMDTIFLDITSSGEGRGNLYSSSDLEWHMDGGYMQDPVHVTGLYAVDVSDDAGRTMFVSNRIECPIPDRLVSANMDRFTKSERYGYKFKTEADRRWFRLKYRNVKHQLVQEDSKSKYVFYSEAYTDLPLDEKKIMEDILYAPDRIYYHKWKKGDLMISNNLTTNHKREGTSAGNRHLWRLAGAC